MDHSLSARRKTAKKLKFWTTCILGDRNPEPTKLPLNANDDGSSDVGWRRRMKTTENNIDGRDGQKTRPSSRGGTPTTVGSSKKPATIIENDGELN